MAKQPEAQEPKPKAPAKKSSDVLRVSVKRGQGVGKQFRRAGITFTREPQAIRRADLTDAQHQMIVNEPRLVVED